MSISDRIAVMNGGRIEQLGTPEEIYTRPATRFVATFIGSPRIELAAGEVAEDGSIRVGNARIPVAASKLTPGRQVEFGVRPEYVRLGDSGIPATVRLVQPVGPTTHLTLGWDGGTLLATLPGFVRLSPGMKVKTEIDSRHLLVFDRQSGERLSQWILGKAQP